MEDLETRAAQEAALRLDRKVMEGYRLVDVLLTGGAPWGFTLKGGREHGEPLIITKVEDGSKAADCLMAGDEIVNISDFPLSGYRQEAICLVKGSHKTLKMIVKRRSEIAYRPHSWHSTKFIDSTLETVTSHCFNSEAASWNSRYHSSSSPHDLSNQWDQPSLQRSSGHFSSMGSMDSIDQTYQFGRLSSAKSSNSIEHLGHQNKRDSAYGSFSTSFVTPDHALSKTGSASSENILSKSNEWDKSKLGYGKSGQFLNETKALEDKHGYNSPSVLETNRTQRTDDHVESRPSSRSSFGPIWYVPDKKKTTSSPPPPPPPLRSDSFAFIKGHEKPAGPANSEITSTQHFTVANRSQPKPDWNTDITDYHQRLVKVTDRTIADMRRVSNSSSRGDINVEQSMPSINEKYHNNALNSTRLQSSLSTNDVRFAQPTYNYNHQRQYSDESTFFQNTRTSATHKPQHQQIAFYTGVHELSADPAHIYNPPRVPSSSTDNNSGKQRMDITGHNRLYSGTSKQIPQGTNTQQFKEEYCNTEAGSDRMSAAYEDAPIYAQKSSYYLPQQSIESSPENCEKNCLRIIDKRDGHLNNNEKNIQKKNVDYFEEQYEKHNVAQPDNSEKYVLTSRYRPHHRDWGEEERNKITPQITPMLHSLAQEGRNRSERFSDTGNEKQALPTRRSDRFATALRNEIQQKRAHLQKSKSTAALTESVESENSDIWNQDSIEAMNPPSDGSFSSTYKSHLQEAQARVLRATSFKRRDLEPGQSDHPLLSQDRRVQYSNFSTAVFPTETSPLPVELPQPKQMTAGNSSQNISRIGGRKRFSAQQKLKSYSEPEKMNEVGVYEEHANFSSSKTSQEAVGSFADRWKFFEETSKCTQQISAPKYAQPSLAIDKSEKHKDNEHESRDSWRDQSTRAASLGHESLPDQNTGSKYDLQDVDYHTADNAMFDQPQRLGTFAEYQASWKEQKNPLERKNSGRCHSADNILDANLEQSPKAQYVHERSRSSPTTDFYAQGATGDSQQAESAREDSATALYTHCSNDRRGSAVRVAEIVDLSRGKKDSEYNKWKPSAKSVQAIETSKSPEESRARSGTLPSDYRYVHENVKEDNREIGFSAVSENSAKVKNYYNAGENNQWQEQTALNKKRGPAPQRPPPPKLDNRYWRQNGSTSSLAASSESLLVTQGKNVQSHSPSNLDLSISQRTQAQSPVVYPDKLSAYSHDHRFSGSSENESQHLEKKQVDPEPVVPTKSRHLQKPGMEPSRSPSPQFAPQKLTDKPPVLLQDESMSRFERVIDNTKVKMVPIKIVHSESHAEKESRHNLLSAIEPPALPTGLAKDQLKTLSTSEQSYSRFCAYTRHEPDPEDQFKMADEQEFAEDVKENDVSPSGNQKSKDKVYDDLKSEELMREIVGKDKTLAEILDPNAKMRTTMDLMEGIFPKDENLLEEAQQRRKLLPKVPSPRTPEEKKDEQNMPSATPLTTSSTYYSTSAAKAELLIKMKDMQEQHQPEENSEDELDHDLSEKKQELIDSISKKLQVLREAKETLLEDIQCNNALGEEVEVIVKEVCKPNEFDKFRMFIGDLEKIVNLLLSLSGRLARVENALNNLDETVSPEERRTLVEKRKLLTRQHEDAKELKENLDRRERIVFDILASYLNEENLADYEHFVKMKSALILEQRELEDKIKLGEEQLKCLTDSLPSDRIK